ncbi:small multidrug resistance protein [Enterobacter hormaechei]|uniref:DMT family transporter n=1 Tax=Enterobacter hormaechei TaxID=158836 RepID=UPI00079A9BBF|nr:SMR family transporter [Enterobacter hormaechei]SAD45321.1 small multidrug resistance protein [Enterobacter hormaechei]SAD52440.1 small multidrug resistance protein [Enterobacter hormaechei]SAD93128.1 small multidrug resistance protein [Enterobacter hormaechei]
MYIILNCLCWLIISVTMEVTGTLLLPETRHFKNIPLTIHCLICYVISFYSLSMLMGYILPVIAYSIWVGLGIVLITVMSSLFYRLKSSILEKIGIGCIVTGLAIIAF